MCFSGIARAADKRRLRDLLAFPSSGGACSLTFNESASQPTIWSLEELGITFTLRMECVMG